MKEAVDALKGMTEWKGVEQTLTSMVNIGHTWQDTGQAEQMAHKADLAEGQ